MMPVICPIGTCQTENDAEVDVCVRCKTPLRGYIQLSAHTAQLFNKGLDQARSGQFKQARDLFAAVVHWFPLDREARNALAMACFEMGDRVAAREQWEKVLEQYPHDALAQQGLSALENGRDRTIRKKKGKQLKKKGAVTGRNVKKKRSKLVLGQ